MFNDIVVRGWYLTKFPFPSVISLNTPLCVYECVDFWYEVLVWLNDLEKVQYQRVFPRRVEVELGLAKRSKWSGKRCPYIGFLPPRRGCTWKFLQWVGMKGSLRSLLWRIASLGNVPNACDLGSRSSKIVPGVLCANKELLSTQASFFSLSLSPSLPPLRPFCVRSVAHASLLTCSSSSERFFP